MRVFKISLENNDGELLMANLIIRKNNSFKYHGEKIGENNYIIKTDFHKSFYDNNNTERFVNGVSFENAVRNYLEKDFCEFNNRYFTELNMKGDLR